MKNNLFQETNPISGDLLIYVHTANISVQNVDLEHWRILTIINIVHVAKTSTNQEIFQDIDTLLLS